MGFFSWKTQDTNKTIWNRYSGNPTFPVFLLDDKGNHWRENNYQGYGVFGGKDFYELMAEMNGFEKGDQHPRDFRIIGIDLTYKSRLLWTEEMQEHMKKRDIRYPNLVERDPALFHTAWENVPPEDCETQGFFGK